MGCVALPFVCGSQWLSHKQFVGQSGGERGASLLDSVARYIILVLHLQGFIYRTSGLCAEHYPPLPVRVVVS